jgi:hypothetical protein
MQIREILILNEGIMDRVKGAAMSYLDPVGTAQQTQDRYIKHGQQIGAEVLAKLDAQTRRRAEELAAEWIADSGPVPVGTRIKVVHPQNRGIYYKVKDQWTNEKGDPITDPKTIDILNRAMDTGGKQEPIPEAEEFSAGGIAIPAGSKTHTATSDTTGYDKKFVDWANKKLTSKESSTGTGIDLNTVMKDPESANDLRTSLKSVVASKDNPQTLKQTATDFFVRAMKGMQQAAQKIRGTDTPMGGGSARVDSVELDKGQRLAKQVGVDLDKLRQLAGIEATRPTGNPSIDSILTAAGVLR